LATGRPDRFNGVVLAGGVHMDSMRGGNPLIQVAADLVAGIPQPQNPPAVDQLSVTWLIEWFAGDTDTGDELGSRLDDHRRHPAGSCGWHRDRLGGHVAPLLAVPTVGLTRADTAVGNFRGSLGSPSSTL
jgi:hypothetical protein